MDQLTVIFDQYRSLIQNVNESIEKNEEAMHVTLQETQMSSDELSALTTTVSFHVLKNKMY